MDAFARSSSSLLGLLLAASLAAGCTETLDPIEGTASLRVKLESPADTGSTDARLADDQRTVQVSIEALNHQNEIDTTFSGTVDMYAHYLGSLTPEIGRPPLATAQVTNGTSPSVTVELPNVYGPSFLWIEHVSGENPTYATGTTPTLWYRDPYLVDVSRPLDEEALGALERSPLEEKQINVYESQYGATGRMVVTGSYAQGYTLADVQCQDESGTPPCTTGAYDSLFIFTFSRPEDEEGRRIQRGMTIDRVAGSVSEFNGLTEVNFPQSFMSDPTANEARVPDPVEINPDWLVTRIEMERVEAALVAAVDAEVCPLDDDYDTYAQWKLDIGRGCDDPINVITKGEATEFDPSEYVGQTLPRVVGTLRPVNIGSFDVWIIYPRDIADITVP